MSKQHMWPDWLKNVIPREETTRTQTRFWAEHVAEKTLTIQPDFNSKQGHVGTIKIRRVCRTCNNQWMSVLETQAKPFLTSLILGENIAITNEIQLAIAKWTTMTAMVAEYTDEKSIAIPVDHRNYLMKNKFPPSGWRIWIGRYYGNEWKQRYYHNGMAIATREEYEKHLRPSIGNTQSSVFVVGELLILAISSTHHGVDFNLFEKDLSQKLIGIWPSTREFSWHQMQFHSDAEVKTIAHYLPSYFGM